MTIQGLSPSDVVNAQVILQPLPAGTRAFGVPLIVGQSAVINTSERLRQYTSIGAVANDFGTTAPEYLAALLAFSQVPQLQLIYIGRAVLNSGGSSATLFGATLTPTQQLLANFTAITAGSMMITVNGVVKTLSALNFSSATNLNAVANILTTALGTAVVVWDSVYSRFEVTSSTQGTASTLTYATPTGSGTDVSGLLGLSLASGASAPVAGIAQETLVSAVTALMAASADWYMVTIATPTQPTDAAYEALAATIEASNPVRVLGITSESSTLLDPNNTSDLASTLASFDYNRTMTMYSGSSLYAAASIFARAASVDFTGENTTLTLKFQTMPGVAPDTLNETQAAALIAKNANMYVNYSNGTFFYQNGAMASGRFFDEIFNSDALQNAIQTAVFNVLLTAGTKVPQTDAGVHLLVTAIEQVAVQFVANGFLAPGVWTSSLAFGQLQSGQTLSKGFYVYAPPVALQNASDRAARKAPLIQCAFKEAGAIHSGNIQLNIVR